MKRDHDDDVTCVGYSSSWVHDDPLFLNSYSSFIRHVGSGTSPNVTLVNGIAEGTDYDERVGRKIFVTRLDYRWSSYMDSTDTDHMRMIWVWDRYPNGSLAAFTDVVIDTYSLWSSDYVKSPINELNSERFIILEDGLFVQGQNDHGFPVLVREGHIEIGMETLFSGATGDISDIMGGALLCLSNARSADTYLDCICCVRYHDL